MKYIVSCLFLLCLTLEEAQSGKKKKYKVEIKQMKTDANFEGLIPEWDASIQMMEDNTATINGWLYLAQDLPDNTKVKAAGYQKNIDGSWQTFTSFVYESGMCEFMKNDNNTYPAARKCGNLPEKCPVNSGNYSVENWRFGENLPDDIPGDSWIFYIDYILNGKTATTLIVEIFLNRHVQAPGAKPDVVKKPHGSG